MRHSMNEIERALATLQDLLDNSIFASRIDFALEVAIEALREKAERENGCFWCLDVSLNDVRINEVRVNINCCPMCGRRLEVES